MYFEQHLGPIMDMVSKASDLLLDALSVGDLRLDKMYNIQLRNGQNKCKVRF
jgi:hypothetical protein